MKAESECSPLSTALIQEIVQDPACFKQGRALLQKGAVTSASEIRTAVFRVTVEDHKKVDLLIDLRKRAGSPAFYFECGCPLFFRKSTCPHLASSLLFLQNHLQINENGEWTSIGLDEAVREQKALRGRFVQELYLKRLRSCVANALREEFEAYQSASLTESARLSQERSTLRVRYELSVEPRLRQDAFQTQQDNYSFSLRLKLGLSTIYLLKDLRVELERILASEEEVTLGKRFVFRPQEHCLSPEDRSLLKQILILSKQQDQSDRLLLPPREVQSLLAALSSRPELCLKVPSRSGSSAETVSYNDFRYYEHAPTPFPLQYRLFREEDEFRLTRSSQNPEQLSPERLAAAEEEITAAEDLLYLFYESEVLLLGNQIYQIEPALFSAFKALDRIWVYEKLRLRNQGDSRVSILDDFLLRQLCDWSLDLALRDKQRREACALFIVDDQVLRAFTGMPPDPELYLDIEGDRYSAVCYPLGRENAAIEETEGLSQDLVRQRIRNRFRVLFRGWKIEGRRAETEDLNLAGDFLFGKLDRLRSENFFTVYASPAVTAMIDRKPRLPRGFARVTGDKVPLLQITFETPDIRLDELRQIWQDRLSGKRYRKISGGRLLDLHSPSFEDLDRLNSLGLSPADLRPEISLPLYRSFSVLAEHSPLTAERSLLDFRGRLDALRKTRFEWPEEIKAKPFPYQITGFQWLKELNALSFSGVLADDMGLGKTLQIIALIVSAAKEKSPDDPPALVVCPSSVLYNWQNEWRRFAPSLKVRVIDGSRDERSTRIAAALSEKADVLITSYPLLSRDGQLYREHIWDTIVLDESQTVKNKQTQAHRILSTLQRRNLFALSGTPLENRLEELYNLFQLLLPGLLGTPAQFRALSPEAISERIAPFMLRRLKRDVLQDLPDKTEEEILIDLSDEQKKIYLAQLHEVRVGFREVVRAGRLAREKMKVLAGLTRLRQICCDPRLLPDTDLEDGGQPLERSAKLDFLLNYLAEAEESGHRIVLFSQFTSMLSLIRQELDREGMSYHYLDGSTPLEERLSLCRRFNRGEGSLFLLSLRAGGTGLNLTGGDLVILYDSWWNPAIEDQAADRVYRIGQAKTVHVVRLVARGTIEEQLSELHARKRDLVDAVIHSGVHTLSSLSSEELEALLF